jgi:hypothetical protein
MPAPASLTATIFLIRRASAFGTLRGWRRAAWSFDVARSRNRRGMSLRASRAHQDELPDREQQQQERPRDP